MSREVFYKDTDYDPLPDKLDLYFEMPDELDKSQCIALCSLAARLGMETTVYRAPLTRPQELNKLVIRKGPLCRLYKQEANHSHCFVLEGAGAQLIEFTSWLCENFPGRRLAAGGYLLEQLPL